MNHSPPATGNASFHFCPSGLCKFTHFRPCLTPHNPKLSSDGAGLVCRRRCRRGQHRLKFFVAAELSNPLSLNLGLDSQTLDSLDVSELRWIGPIPGDIAEIEAYCRVFRAAESLHSTLMDTLCDPVTGECMVSYDSSSVEKSLWVDKIVSVLGCMVSLLHKGRQDVLSGRSSIMPSSRAIKLSALDLEGKLPPLAVFRGEIKRCCESLHIALVNILTPDDDRSCDVQRKLQRLKNICYDLGFPRGDDSPEHALLANWDPVYLSTSKEGVKSGDSEVAFWKGGQLTKDGLKWLLEKGFKTIVDVRDEIVRDNFYHSALKDSIESGKVELIQLPVEIGMAPSMEQVEKFASLVCDSNKRPICLHSREGVWRTSAMISRWRQYIAQVELQIVPSINSNRYSPQVSNGSSFSRVSSNGRKDGLLKKDESLQADSNRKSIPDSLDQTSTYGDTRDRRTNGTCNGPVNSQPIPLDEAIGIKHVRPIYMNPLNAQLPPKNAFSRKKCLGF